MIVFPAAWLRVATRSYHWLNTGRSAAGLNDISELIKHLPLMLSLKIKSAELHNKIIGGDLSGTILDTLHRYKNRIITRATPFMLFSGFGTVNVQDHENIILADNSEWEVDLFPASEPLAQAGERHLTQDQRREAAPFRLNESLLIRGGVLCAFVEHAQVESKSTVPGYRLLCLRGGKALEQWLTEPAQTSSWAELRRSAQAAHPTADVSTIEAYLDELHRLGIITGIYQSPLLGSKSEDDFYDASSVPYAAEKEYRNIKLSDLNPEKIDELRDAYSQSGGPQQTTTHSHTAGSLVDARQHSVINATLKLKVERGGLSQAWFAGLGEAVQALPQLWSNDLSSYRRLIADYLAQGSLVRRVPLLELVWAVARSAHLEDTLPPPRPRRAAAEPAGGEVAWQTDLRNQLWHADLVGSEEIQIDQLASDSPAFPGQASSPPRWVESRVRLVRQGSRTRLWLIACTSEVGHGLNRLMHRLPQDPMLQQLRGIWRAQEQAAAPGILAEITCGGGGRARDVSLRPLTYQHQIVLHGAPSVPTERQIHPKELSVFLSADGPVLWWEKRGVPVTAHQLSALIMPAFSPVVHVLLALDPRPRQFSLLLPSGGLPPCTARIAYRDIILRPRTWLLPPNLQHALRQPARGRNERQLRELLSAFRERYQVPRLVRLGDMDHNAVDLEDPHALGELADMVEDGLERISEEFLNDDSPVHGSDGPRVAEAVVHLELAPSSVPEAVTPGVTTSDVSLPSSAWSEPSNPGNLETAALRAQHVFYPGSAWLYLKLYYGAGLGSDAATRAFIDDDLLGRVLAPLLFDCEKKGLLADYHFVRYADPEAHLRLRIRPASEASGAAARLLDVLAPQLQSAAQARAFERWTVDTYVREVDRYGGPQLIATAEQLFTADSRLCLRMLAACHRDRLQPETELRRLLPVYTLHRLLACFGLNLAQRSDFLSRIRRRPAIAQVFSAERRRRLDREYRQLAGPLQAILRQLDGEADAAPPLLTRKDVRAWYAPYQDVVAATATIYRRAAEAGQLSTPLPEVLRSFLHMHCNRLFASPDFEAEIVYFAQRAAEALLARRRQASLD